MKTVTLKIAGLDKAINQFRQVWDGKAVPDETGAITFASWDLMHKILSPKRLELLRALCGETPMSIRELSRRVGRDFKGVHTDVTSLVNAGLIDRSDEKISFPFEKIHIEFDIEAAA